MISTAPAFFSSPACAARSAMRWALAEGRAVTPAPSARSRGRGRVLGLGAFNFTDNCIPSATNLPFSEHDPLFRGQTLEAHGAICVKFRRGNTDLGSEAELASIVETSRGVHQHAAGVRLVEPALCAALAIGANRFGVIRSVAFDV